MILIDNDYMINEKGLDVRSKLNVKDNNSNISDIFFKQLSSRVYDYVINNNVRHKSRYAIDLYLNTEPKIEDFKRALSEQALYFLSVGDTSLMLPEEVTRFIGLEGWNSLSMCTQTVNILNQLGLLIRVEEM